LANSQIMATAEVHANDDAEDLQLNQMIRPCVDCGRYTGGYCVGVGIEDGPEDNCFAMDWLPAEPWCCGQPTPLCTSCERAYGFCHFCRKIASCRPFAWGIKPPDPVMWPRGGPGLD
jgi:hypothetical protein